MSVPSRAQQVGGVASVRMLSQARDFGGWGQESESLVSAPCLMICSHLGQPVPLPGSTFPTGMMRVSKVVYKRPLSWPKRCCHDLPEPPGLAGVRLGL